MAMAPSRLICVIKSTSPHFFKGIAGRTRGFLPELLFPAPSIIYSLVGEKFVVEMVFYFGHICGDVGMFE